MCGKQKYKKNASTGQVADLLPTLNNFVWQEREKAVIIFINNQKKSN